MYMKRIGKLLNIQGILQRQIFCYDVVSFYIVKGMFQVSSEQIFFKIRSKQLG